MYNIKSKLVPNKPVASFFYRGNSHSHPVKRTLLITNQNKNIIKGYEIQEGKTIRLLDDDVPFKTFRIDRIATTSQLRKDNLRYNKKNISTYTRMSLSKLLM